LFHVEQFSERRAFGEKCWKWLSFNRLNLRVL
jgi:hypothetical protein